MRLGVQKLKNFIAVFVFFIEFWSGVPPLWATSCAVTSITTLDPQGPGTPHNYDSLEVFHRIDPDNPIIYITFTAPMDPSSLNTESVGIYALVPHKPEVILASPLVVLSYTIDANPDNIHFILHLKPSELKSDTKYQVYVKGLMSVDAPAYLRQNVVNFPDTSTPLDFGGSETQYNGSKAFLDAPAAACGDGKVDPGEVCDDGNVIDGDGCSKDCKDIEKCGDVDLDPGEQCDHGTKNGTTGDDCDATCQKIAPKVAGACTLEAELQNKDYYSKPIALLNSFVFKFTDIQPDATPQPIVPEYIKPYTSVTAANHTDVFRILAVGGNANCYFDPNKNHFKIINFLDMPQWVAIYLTNPLQYNCEYRFTMRTGVAITEGGKCLKSFDDFTFSTGDDPNAPAAPWVFHMFQMKVPPSMNFIAIPPK